MCRERGFRAFLFVAREDYALFYMLREMNPRTLSDKFLPVKCCYPESFSFLGHLAACFISFIEISLTNRNFFLRVGSDKSEYVCFFPLSFTVERYNILGLSSTGTTCAKNEETSKNDQRNHPARPEHRDS